MRCDRIALLRTDTPTHHQALIVVAVTQLPGDSCIIANEFSSFGVITQEIWSRIHSVSCRGLITDQGGSDDGLSQVTDTQPRRHTPSACCCSMGLLAS